MSDIKKLLERVQSGTLSVDEALLTIKEKPFDDLGYAVVDLHRKVRQGATEVVYGAGKSAQQIIGILKSLKQNGEKSISRW